MRTISRFILFSTILGLLYCCNTSKPKKSLDDLRVAFNYESTSAEKYAKFAQAAMKEGYDTIYQLFKAVSMSESIQASNFGKVIEKLSGSAVTADIGSFEVKTTAENIQAAIKTEIYAMHSLYPGFIRDGENEKAPDAAKSFTWAWNTKKGNFKYFRGALAAIVAGNESRLPFSWLVCPTCGNSCSKEDLKDACDFCLTKKEQFSGYQEKPEGE